MKGIILYFSGSGNTKYIVNKTYEEFVKNGCELDVHSIEEKISLDFSAYDFLVIGFPKYFHDMPKIFFDYIRENLNYSSNEINTMIFSTGSENRATNYNEIEKVLSEKNYKVMVTKNFQMPNSFTINKNYEKNTRKDIRDIYEKTLLEIRELVVNFLTENTVKEKIGNWQSVFYKNINKYLTKDLYKNSSKFSVNDNCDKCNICVKSCPTMNIENIGEMIKFRDNCIMCCRCLNLCPKNAILYNDKEHLQYKENIDLIIS
ncbi:NADH-plastoquinone oxidoreductase subunit [Clostridium tertium]|uniref:NADH-plastoquinone oxidoreductase subunit n=1 Tax=Clostridium tertium TaxID=1559 RepID=A0A6N3BVI9_9CLOT